MFNTDIEESELDEVNFLNNSEILLESALTEGGLDASPEGNIGMGSVRNLLNRMQFGPGTLEIEDVAEETEARPLHILRVVLEVAKKNKKEKDSFRITSRGEDFLNEKSAGELLEHLFVTYFRVFNLAYFTRGGELAEIQGLFPYSLYKLGWMEDCEEWMERKDLVSSLVPPPMKEGSDEKRMEFLTIVYAGRVLEPLVKFALLDARGYGEPGIFQVNLDYRKTDFFDKFIEFRVSGSRQSD